MMQPRQDRMPDLISFNCLVMQYRYCILPTLVLVVMHADRNAQNIDLDRLLLPSTIPALLRCKQLAWGKCFHIMTMVLPVHTCMNVFDKPCIQRMPPAKLIERCKATACEVWQYHALGMWLSQLDSFAYLL